MNTTEFLSVTAAIVPDREAIVFDDRRISYGELQERVNRLANALADIGVGPGDRIALMQVNCNEHIESYFAAAKLDAMVVPINFRAKSEELEQMLTIAQPSLLFIRLRPGKRVLGNIVAVKVCVWIRLSYFNQRNAGTTAYVCDFRSSLELLNNAGKFWQHDRNERVTIPRRKYALYALRTLRPARVVR